MPYLILLISFQVNSDCFAKFPSFTWLVACRQARLQPQYINTIYWIPDHDANSDATVMALITSTWHEYLYTFCTAQGTICTCNFERVDWELNCVQSSTIFCSYSCVMFGTNIGIQTYNNICILNSDTRKKGFIILCCTCTLLCT